MRPPSWLKDTLQRITLVVGKENKLITLLMLGKNLILRLKAEWCGSVNS